MKPSDFPRERLAHPSDEMLDVLVAAWKDGTINDPELLGYLFGFTAAGTDTTGASLANAFSYLAEFNKLDWARDRIDDEALRRAVRRDDTQADRLKSPPQRR